MLLGSKMYLLCPGILRLGPFHPQGQRVKSTRATLINALTTLFELAEYAYGPGVELWA